MKRPLSLNQQNLIVGIVQGTVQDAFAMEAQRMTVQKRPVDLEPYFAPYTGNSLNMTLDKIILQLKWDTRTLVKLHFIRLWFPWQPNKTKWQDFESTLRELTIMKNPIYFLIIGNRKLIIHCLAVSPEDLMPMKNALKSRYSDMEFTLMTNPFLEFNEVVKMVSKETHDWDFRDYYAGQAYWRRLSVDEHMQFSPIASVYSAINSLEEDELGWYQVVPKPTIYPWSENILKLIETECEAIKYGGNVNFSGWYYPGFGDKENKIKVNSPIVAVVVRIGVFVRKEKISGALESLSLPFRNFQFAGSRLNYLDKTDYRGVIDNASKLMKIIASGIVFHSGNLFSTRECSYLLHFPTGEILENEDYKIDRIRGLKVPNWLMGEGISAGYSDYIGKRIVIRIPEKIQPPHIGMSGRSGKGKSIAAANMALDCIRRNQGVGIIDPHGTFIDEVIPVIGKDKIEKTLFFSLSDKEYTPCYNSFRTGNDISKIVDDHTFRIRSLFPGNAWGPSLEADFKHIFYAIAITPGLSLSDAGTLLSKSSEGERLRQYILPFLKDKDEERFWTEEFYQLSGISRLTTKLTFFLQPERSKRLFSQKENKINFRHIIDNRGIFIGDLPAGIIGNDLTDILGSCLISAFYEAAISRMDLIDDNGRFDSETRFPIFNLFVDEFHRFPTKIFEHSLKELRKFNIRLILIFQQKENCLNEAIKSAMGNIGSWVMLSQNWEDAQQAFKECYGLIPAAEFMRRDIGDGFAKIGDTIVSIKTFPPNKIKGSGFKKEIIQYSREHYYTRIKDGHIDTNMQTGTTKNKKKQRALYDEI